MNPNTPYTLTIKAVNGDHVTNETDVSNVSIYTLGIIASASAAAVTASAASLTIDGSYATFNILSDGTTLLSDASGISCDVTGLNPNTSYTLSIQAVNGDHVTNETDVSNVAIYTLGVISEASSSNITPYSVTLTVSGSYYLFNVSDGTSIIMSDVSGTICDISGLVPDTQYTLIVEPINGNSDVGTATQSVTFSTLAA